ncbi:MAG: pyridoxal-phosphate dependent enzyme [Candidatus Jordarchaeales archaeon]|nr:pyridoxal-phosphate dependent enzyme [Candidatus Jordarchaeia archaeon]
MNVDLRCTLCGSEKKPFPPVARCDKCGGILDYVYDYLEIKLPYSDRRGMWRYRPILPPISEENIVSMGEGGTPLREAKELAEAMGGGKVLLKDETANPTNSYRDRAASLIVSNALDVGAKKLICASYGNFGASAAAYCAKAKIKCTIITPRNVNVSKLAQMYIYGGHIVRSGDVIDDAIAEAERAADGYYQATPELNPLSVEAQKTISHEVLEACRNVDVIIVPTGTGNTAYSIWKGVKECLTLGVVDHIPRMVLVQPDGCATLINEGGKVRVRRVEKPATAASPLVSLMPAYGLLAARAVEESGGFIVTVTDREIIEAEKLLAKAEGIFSEPASAASVACLRKMKDEGFIDHSEVAVCLITASGLKDPYIIDALADGGRRGVKSRGGFKTKFEILRFLEIGESYGYEIWKSIGKRLSIQAVYQHLGELQERGLIEEYYRGRRKYFKLTQRGRRVLRALEEVSLIF